MFEIIPIAELIQDAFNASLYEAEEYLSGNFVRVDTTMIKITSFKDLVDAIDVGIRNGVFTINEGRERVGNDRSDKAMADEIFITKTTNKYRKEVRRMTTMKTFLAVKNEGTVPQILFRDLLVLVGSLKGILTRNQKYFG